nr:MAG: RNA-dependent RNA polymerase [Physalis chlorosis virus]
MAFNQRTCREKFFSDLSLDSQEGLRRIYLPGFINNETDISELFPYDLPSKSKNWLISEGFDLPLYATQNHTHPVCKSIENFILFKFFVPFTNRVKSVCAISMKNSKRKFISYKIKSDAQISIINSLIVPKDLWRYGRASKTDCVVQNRFDFFPKGEGLNFFFFDEMHYWSQMKLVNFLRESSPNEILATFIYPPELLVGVNTSLNPNVYEFEVTGKKFLFMPDGRRSEGYMQDVSNCWIFKISSLEVCDGIFYNFSLIRSVGAHHVFHIWRSHEPLIPERRSFDSFTHVPFSSFAFGFGPLKSGNFRISYDVLKKTIAYLMTLKRVDPQSSIAKFRQLANDNFETSELLFIRQIEQELEKQGVDNIFNKGVFSWFSSKVKDLIDPMLEGLIGYKIYRGLTEDILNFNKFSLDIETESYVGGEVDRWLLDLELMVKSTDAKLGGTHSLESLEVVDNLLGRKVNGEVVITKENIFSAVLFGVLEKECVPDSYFSYLCSYPKLDRSDVEIELPLVVYDESFSVHQKKWHNFIPKVNRSMLDNFDPFTRLFFESKLKDDLEGELSGFSESKEPEIKKGTSIKKMKGKSVLFDDPILSHLFTSDEASSSGVSIQRPCETDKEVEDVCLSNGPEVKKEEGFEKSIKVDVDLEAEVNAGFVRKENSCLLISVAEILKEKEEVLLSRSLTLRDHYHNDSKVDLTELDTIATELNCNLYIIKEDGVSSFGPPLENNESKEVKPIIFSGGHFFTESYFNGFMLSRNPSHFSGALAEWNLFSMGKFFRGKTLDKRQKGLTEGTLRVTDLDFKRAAKLMGSFLFSTSGCKLDSPFHEGWKVIAGLESQDCVNVSRCCNKIESIFKKSLSNADDRGSCKEVGVSCISGAPGSGKSSLVIETLKETKSLSAERSLFISPRAMLRDEVVEKIGEGSLKVKNVKTYEVALTSNIGLVSLLVIDELPILPNGYMDLVVCKWLMERRQLGLDYTDCRLVILCDPMQSSYHMREDLAFLDSKSEFSRLKEVIPKINYLNQSFRLGNEIAARFGLDSVRGNDKTKWKFQDEIFQDLASALSITGMSDLVGDFKEVCILVPSCDEVTSSPFKEGMATYNKSQGINSKFCFIGLSSGSHKSSDNQMYVALTRASKGFCFFLSDSRDVKTFLRRGKTSLLSRYLEKDFASVGKYMKAIMDKSLKTESSVGGNFNQDEDLFESLMVDGVDREEKSRGDPWMKGMLHLMLDDGVLTTPNRDEKIPSSDGGLKCHLPLVDSRNFSLRLDAIKAREFREFKGDDGWSKQFCEEKGRWCSNLLMDLPQCSMVRAIYPRHFADDDLTFKKAVEKRLRFSNYSKEKAKFNDNLMRGKIIFDHFNKFFNLKEERNSALFMEAERDFMRVKMQKNAATIENHSGRSDPDWEWNKVLIFMKSQLCSKFEKRFVDAKAGQTLACFSHNTLFRFNAWCRYTEKIFMRHCPSNFYIHQKRSFEDLNEFSKKYAGNGVSVESDYEAFDASQDSLILAFEYHLLKHIGWPEDVLNDYLEMKFSLFSKLGNFAIMRFTGEFCTFLFNTFANIAFTLMRYDIKGNEPICFAGDDMCALTNLKVSNKFDGILERLSLKAKVTYTERPTFCGWLMTQFGIVKKPELILERLIAASEVGKLEQVLDSYFLELSYGYRLGEYLFQTFSEEEINDQQQLVRFFVKRGAQLKGASQAILFNLQYLSDDE